MYIGIQFYRVTIFWVSAQEAPKTHTSRSPQPQIFFFKSSIVRRFITTIMWTSNTNPLDALIDRIITSSMQHHFKYSPKPFQRETLRVLLKMRVKGNQKNGSPHPTYLVLVVASLLFATPTLPLSVALSHTYVPGTVFIYYTLIHTRIVIPPSVHPHPAS